LNDDDDDADDGCESRDDDDDAEVIERGCLTLRHGFGLTSNEALNLRR